MSGPAPDATLTVAEVKRLVTDWFAKLDAHAPVEEILPMLADEELEVKLPEGTLRGHAAFRGWYEGVIRRFFDEVHELTRLDVQIPEVEARVTLVVNWQARVWTPPAATSRWLGLDAAQRWIVRRSPANAAPVIVSYLVDSLTPMPGSPGLGDP